MSNEIRDSRLAGELRKMQRLTEESSLIQFTANDEHLPDQYYVEFLCTGLVLKDVPIHRHVVHIYLPSDYPKIPPAIRFKTPIFHPNIKAMMDDNQEISRFAESVGGIENLGRLYHEKPAIRDLFDAHICLDVLQGKWTPDYTLYQICLELGAMIQFQRYNVKDPLNKEAADWTEQAAKLGRLPVDSRNLLDRRQIPILAGPATATIRILKVEKLAK